MISSSSLASSLFTPSLIILTTLAVASPFLVSLARLLAPDFTLPALYASILLCKAAIDAINLSPLLASLLSLASSLPASLPWYENVRPLACSIPRISLPSCMSSRCSGVKVPVLASLFSLRVLSAGLEIGGESVWVEMEALVGIPSSPIWRSSLLPLSFSFSFAAIQYRQVP